MVNFGIVGTGGIAETHIKSIRAIEGAQVLAISSQSAERAQAASHKFGVRNYVGFEAMMDAEKLDVICICSTSGQHLPPTIAAAQRGIHVLTEKPLEVSLDRAQQMVDVCYQYQVKLGCIFQNRFKPGFQQLKQAVKNGQLGKIIAGNAYIKWYRAPEYYATSTWKGTKAGDGGAALINQGIHTIDLLLDIMGPVRTVFGKTATSTHQIEGEDIGMALLSFENNALGAIQGSTAMYPGYPERLEIYGTKGSVVLENGLIQAWNVEGEMINAEDASDLPITAADPLAIGHTFHQIQIEDMVNAIREDRPPLIDGAEGLKALALILAIYRSAAQGEEIML